MSIEVLIAVLGIVFLAAFVKSAFGFGEGMVNMALLTMVVDLNFSGPFVAIIALAGGVFMLIKDWKMVAWRELRKLLFGAIVFIPIGLFAGLYANEQIMTSILGALIVAFALYKLSAPELGKLKNSNWGLAFGAVGGFFGGAYNVAGPPAALFGNMREWNPAVFRVSLQGYYVPISLFALTGRAMAGQYNSDILLASIYSIPAIVLGILVGKALNQRIKNPLVFQRIIYSMLIILGILLFF
jgi:uncharacterized membrane protein YfcA